MKLRVVASDEVSVSKVEARVSWSEGEAAPGVAGRSLSAAGDGRPWCLAVMYNYVHDEEPLHREGMPGVTGVEFRAQLDHLGSTMEPVDWPSLYAWTEGRATIPDRSFLLTFLLPIGLRNAALDALFRRHIGSRPRWARESYLSWDDLAQMEGLGHTIGGHGYSHEPYLRFSPSQRRRDVWQVAEVLREGLGSDVRPLSYPYGSFDEVSCEACRRAGFVHAFTSEQQWIMPGGDGHRLPRVDLLAAGVLVGGDS